MAVSITTTIASGVVKDLLLVPADIAQVRAAKLRIAVVSGTSVDLWVRWGKTVAAITDPAADGANSIFVNTESVATGYWEIDVPGDTLAVKILGAGTPKLNVQIT